MIDTEVLIPVLKYILTSEQKEQLRSDLWKANEGESCVLCGLKAGHKDGCLVPMLEEKEEQPIYQHDCPQCTFLGIYRVTPRDKVETYDLYWCALEGGPNVYARYGNDINIMTGRGIPKTVFSHNPWHPIVVAYSRAQKRGLEVWEAE
jgi:hypothetical protein